MKQFFTLLSCLLHLPLFASFSPDTLVKTSTTCISISQLTAGDTVACIDNHGYRTCKAITAIRMHRVQLCLVMVLDDDIIITTSDQKLYCPQERVFKDAVHFQVGDALLTSTDDHAIIRDIYTTESDQQFYDIAVTECHNFFVSRHEILVHNVAPVAIGLAWAFGGGAIEFTGTSIGTALFGITVGAKMHMDKNHSNAIDSFEIYTGADELTYFTEAQAPGKPTEKDGYVPPKKWDGKKVKHPKTGQVGYPDKKGNVWVPTGPGSSAHGSPHWDVVSEDGKNHWNIVPGGRIRGEK